jgi:hypothetical protein
MVQHQSWLAQSLGSLGVTYIVKSFIQEVQHKPKQQEWQDVKINFPLKPPESLRILVIAAVGLQDDAVLVPIHGSIIDIGASDFGEWR